MSKKDLPDFKTPEDFDEWVELNDTSKYSLQDAPEVKIRPKKKPITIKIWPHLLHRVKFIAKNRDMPYQSLINYWLIEKVTEETIQKK